MLTEKTGNMQMNSKLKSNVISNKAEVAVAASAVWVVATGPLQRETHKQILEVNGKKIRITVPAGVADGQTIKLNGQGGPGMNGGPAGDLYITFVIGDDPVYKREGDNLYMNVPIDLYTAVLGGEQIIETLNGKVKMKIKPETQNGTKVRLRGKGFPVYKQDGQFGDLFVTYEVKIPTHLTEKQKELFRELQNS